jgi:uncharacterized repeat protein (TIGR01451 family)
VRSDVLAVSSSYPSITVNALVSQSAPVTLTNTAVVGGGGEGNLLNDTATDVASVVSTVDLSVTDGASPNPVAAGGNITYTQVVTNSGPSAADNATVVTTIPANTTLVSIASPAGWSCIGAGAGATGNIVCTDVSMAGLTAATFSLVVKVNAGTANGSDGNERGLAQSGAGRQQHYLYPGSDEYRNDRGYGRHVHREHTGEYHVCFDHATRGLELCSVPAAMYECERRRWGDWHVQRGL